MDELERDYINYIKSIFVEYYDEDGHKFYGFVENNEKSRFLREYEDSLGSYVFNDVDPFKVIELINSDEKIVVDFFASKFNDVNKDKEYRFKRASIDWTMREFYRVKKEYDEYKEKEKSNLTMINFLEEKLKAGEAVFYEFKLDDISEEEGFNHLAEMKKWKNLLSYSEYMKKRDKVKTKELLDDLDCLSLEEIRQKYFKKEVVSQDEQNV